MLRLIAAYDRTLRRSFAALESLHTGVLLGLLRAGTLERLTQLAYRKRDLYLDPGHNASGLFEWEDAAIRQHFREGSRVLLMGCGGGRELLALARNGYAVDACDPNAGYVAQAQRNLLDRRMPGRVLCAAPDALPDGFDGSYDGMVLGWGMYTHIVGRDRRIALLRRLRGRAAAGAPLLLSFWTRNALSRRERMQHGVAALLAVCSLNPRRPEFGDDLNQQAFVHRFDETEISEELREAGFRALSYSATPYGHAIAIAADPTD